MKDKAIIYSTAKASQTFEMGETNRKNNRLQKQMEDIQEEMLSLTTMLEDEEQD